MKTVGKGDRFHGNGVGRSMFWGRLEVDVYSATGGYR